MSTNNSQKTSNIIPFGKYKGQPVEVLAADPSYCEWLTAQAGFRDRYEDIYLLIVNHFHQPEETPAHNAMVGAFLRDEYVSAFIRAVACHFGVARDADIVDFSPPTFEKSGWDVSFDGGCYSRDLVTDDALNNGSFLWSRLSVECKPTMSDEFPAVLRQIRARVGRRWPGQAILLVGQYSGVGVCKDDLVEIFRRSEISVIFSDDVAAMMARDGDPSDR